MVTDDEDVELHAELCAHLESTYNVRIVGARRLQAWNPYVHRVDQDDSPPWVARVAKPERPVARVHGDAEVLAHLGTLGYPAERLAHPEPVSIMGSKPVLITEFISGTQPPGTAPTQRVLASLLGRLATLPSDTGAPARPAGAWGGDPRHEGRPCEDIAAAAELLDEIDGRVPRQYTKRYESLHRQVEGLDDLEGLPEALIHPDVGPVNAVRGHDRSIVLIDWTSAGRGPRLAAFGWLLNGGTTPGNRLDPRKTDALAAGYAEHVRLTDEELARIPDAMRIRSLYFACWYFHRAIVQDTELSPQAKWACRDETNAVGHAIAGRVRAIIAG